MNALYSRMRGYADTSMSYVSIAQSFRMVNIINHSADTSCSSVVFRHFPYPSSPHSLVQTMVSEGGPEVDSVKRIVSSARGLERRSKKRCTAGGLGLPVGLV